ncbi:MAG: ABC transporter substrate-binding protein [Deltaproteobacteria bacterium]|jgi:peptide/nickel transport system substrate-binding protein|nr:ABC transporter substrate-binding protein [Deltaproteobacteria bacterium]
MNPRLVFWLALIVGALAILGPGLGRADTLRLVYPAAPASLDPHHWPRDPAAEPIIMMVYGRLMGLRAGQGQLDTTDSLAHTIRVSDDDLMYTVRMREGLTFSDGRPVNAQAALFSFDRLMASEAGRNLFPHLRGFNIIGDYTFSLVLTRPWPPFMASLALPQASLISPGLADREAGYLNGHSLGSGRLMVESLTPQSLALTLRPDLPSRPKLDRVEFYYEPEAAKRLTLFTETRAHILLGPPESGPPLSPDQVLVETPTWATRYLAFNLKSPYLAMVGARGALAVLARSAFAAARFKPQGVFPAGFFAGPVAPGPAEDETRAREILVAIGPPKTPLNLAYPSEEPWARGDAESLQRVFLANNIPVNLIPLNGQAGRAWLETGDYDLLLDSRAPQIPSPEMWLGRFLESSAAGRGNPAFFANHQADELIQGFRSAPARAQREQKVGELAALAERESPYAFLYQKSLRFLVDKRLAELKPHPMWPETWPIGQVNLHPFRETHPPKVERPAPEVREFNELVAEPWE